VESASAAVLDVARQTRAIVVHYGDPALTVRALASLTRGKVRPGLIVVVDNGPEGMEFGPESVAAVASEVILVRPGRNTGFAGGVQLGLRAAGPIETRHVWLFNNDAEAEPDALAELIEARLRLGERSLVSSLIMNSDGGGTWFEYAVFLPWRLEGRHVPYRGAMKSDVAMSNSVGWRSVRYLPGCSLLAPMTVFAEAGDIDDSFFMYGEDVDLSLRAQRAGYRLVVARRSIVHHRASSGTNVAARERLMAAASFRITARYYPWLIPPAIVGGLLTGLKRGAGRGQPWQFTSRLAGYTDALLRRGLRRG
jgi:GT2 family glycosyltransferase